MRRADKLNGLKSWWNRFCKPEYKIKISAEELKNTHHVLAEAEQFLKE